MEIQTINKSLSPRKETTSESEDDIDYNVVDKIIDKRGHGDNLRYFVQWIGCGLDNCTWELPGNLKHVQWMVEDFERKHANDIPFTHQEVDPKALELANEDEVPLPKLPKRKKESDKKKNKKKKSNRVKKSKKIAPKEIPLERHSITKQLATNPKKKRDNVELDIDNDTVRFEVEKILAKRKANRAGYEYLVKWKDYPDSENTWEPAENLHGALRKIREFNARDRELHKNLVNEEFNYDENFPREEFIKPKKRNFSLDRYNPQIQIKHPKKKRRLSGSEAKGSESASTKLKSLKQLSNFPEEESKSGASKSDSDMKKFHHSNYPDWQDEDINYSSINRQDSEKKKAISYFG